jgi:single-stranded-DNA-specific exonuclease
MAAGLSLPTENIGPLRQAFETAVAEMLSSEKLNPQLEIDCEIALSEITPRLMDELERLSPYGTDNPQPVFMARNLKVAKAFIVGQRHRRMQLCQPPHSGKLIGAMQFNIDSDTPLAESFERMAFRLQWNRYKGEKKMQIIVEAS